MNKGLQKMKLESKSEQQNMNKKNFDLKKIDFKALSTINNAKMMINKQEIMEPSESSENQEEEDKVS